MSQRWERRTIDEIADHSLGKMLDRAKNKGELRPYLRNQNVRWFEFDLSDVHEMRFLPGESTRCSAIRGDVLVCEGGYPGRAAVWEQDEPIHFQKALHRVRFREPERARWFLYYLRFRDLEGTLRRHFTGTGIQHLTGESLGRLSIPLPPLKERLRIVSTLDEAFKGIAASRENAEKNLRNARAVFDGHLESIFIRRGEGWIDRSFGDLATFRNGINFTKSSRGESVKIVGVRDFQDAFWASLDQLDTVTIDGTLLEADSLDEGDLLFVRSNGNVELIGRCLLVGGVRERITHSGFTIRARLVDNSVSPRYLCHFLKSSTARDEMIAGGTGTNIKSLSQTILSLLSIPVPPGAEQIRIVDQLETLAAETKRLECVYQRKFAALEELKQSLLHQAFAGRL